MTILFFWLLATLTGTPALTALRVILGLSLLKGSISVAVIVYDKYEQKKFKEREEAGIRKGTQGPRVGLI